MDGTPFGRYRLVELLGRGGMGEVWRAHDTETDRIVAIKLLPPYLSEDEEFQRRFRREAHAAARLNNPHVIPIHNYGEIDGRLYVDMRLIEGRDLQTLLAEGPLDPARAVRIIDQVAKALHGAHRAGLLHRDVKPSNILIDGDDFAYLIDFGIARAVDETRMTKSGNTIGTFHYIAPERLDGQVEEDARADIYSLACVLYESLTGEPPFGDATMARLITAHLSAPPPRPSISRPDVPAQVDEVIARGMAKDPNQRYATTVELADAARNAITEPIARPTSSPTALRATELAGSHVVAASTFAATQQGWPPTSHSPSFEQPRPETVSTTWWHQRRPGPILAAIVVLLAAVGITGYLLRPNPPAPPTPIAQPAPPSAPTSATPRPVPPVTLDALTGLLLNPDQINTAVGAPGAMTVKFTFDDMLTANVSDTACIGVIASRDTQAYNGSGWSAVRGNQLQSEQDNGGAASQFVVLFPSAHEAQAFFNASAQRWPACSNRQYTITQPGSSPTTVDVGLVSNTNGTLSAPFGKGCGHALTVANNVAIDAAACFLSNAAAVNSAVDIVHQIAAKVPTA